MLALLIIIGIQIFLAVFFIRYLMRNDRGAKEPKSAIRAAIGFGLLALIIVFPFTMLMTLFPGLKELSEITHEQIRSGDIDITIVFLSMMLVGVIEESAKALPLALYIYKKPYFNEITDGVFYFGIVGITFSVIESIFYTLQYGAGVGIGRLILTPFLHTGFSMWFGYTLARYKLHTGGIHLVIIAFVSSMLLHGMYNFGMSSGMLGYFIFSLIIAIALNIGVFLLYRHAQDEDVSINIASNNNNFCRSCGKPNAKHTLFCESCGQHT